MNDQVKYETIISKACNLQEKAILYNIDIISDRIKFITWFVAFSTAAVGFIITNQIELLQNSLLGLRNKHILLQITYFTLLISIITYAINFYLLNETNKLYRILISRFREQEYNLLWDNEKAELNPPTFEGNEELTKGFSKISNMLLIYKLEHGDFLDDKRKNEFNSCGAQIKKYEKWTNILLFTQLSSLLLGFIFITLIAIK